MRRLTFLSMWLLIAAAANAQMRGVGRLQGNVFEKNSGKPIAGATVTIAIVSGTTQPIVVKSDGRGHWAALGLTSGVWNIDIAAPGYVTGRGTATVSEATSVPPIRIELEPEAKQETVAAVPNAPSVPKEAIDAIKEGQELLRATGTATEAQANAKRAVADFEKALPMIPEDTPQLKDVRNQVLQVLAQAYYRSGDVKAAIATFEKLETLDPMTPTPDAAHVTREVLLANLYLENGQLEQGKALLDKLPQSAIADATAYVNIGVLFFNKKNASEAASYFTKAIALDPKNADSYYYRGLAELQMRKTTEAKADFHQVIALAPESTAANDAKQLLANLK